MATCPRANPASNIDNGWKDTFTCPPPLCPRCGGTDSDRARAGGCPEGGRAISNLTPEELRKSQQEEIDAARSFLGVRDWGNALAALRIVQRAERWLSSRPLMTLDIGPQNRAAMQASQKELIFAALAFLDIGDWEEALMVLRSIEMLERLLYPNRQIPWEARRC
jgi:hypothetical protein